MTTTQVIAEDMMIKPHVKKDSRQGIIELAKIIARKMAEQDFKKKDKAA